MKRFAAALLLLALTGCYAYPPATAPYYVQPAPYYYGPRQATYVEPYPATAYYPPAPVSVGIGLGYSSGGGRRHWH